MKKVHQSPQQTAPQESSFPQELEATRIDSSSRRTSPDLDSDDALVKAIQIAKASNATTEESFPVDEAFVQEVGARAKQLKQTTLNEDDIRNTVPSTGNKSRNSLFEPAALEGELGRIGSYRILRLIGQGGMGQVYEAEDTQLNRKVAIKIMQADLSCSETHRARFLREAQLAAKVESDYVCPIYQVGDSTNSPFIAMPFLQGQCLEAKLSECSLTILEVLTISIQIAKGLAAAHALNLTHRDVKPSNIFLEVRSDQTERVRILDFGLARVEEGNLTLTGEGTILGTPAYMSPEQARGEKLDSRSDLFSLGVVIYEMLTGKRPFQGKSATSQISSLLVDQPQSPEVHKPSIPKELSQLVMHLLEKSPNDRIPTSVAVVKALETCLEHLSLERTLELPASLEQPASGVVQEVNIGSPDTQVVGTEVVGRLATQVRPRRSSKLSAYLMGSAAAGLLAWMASVLVFTTPNGTLIVEADDESDLRLRNGEIHIFDENGKLAYKLAPSEKQKGIASGTYMVKVEGVDGVQLSTPKFEMKKNERVVVRATAVDPARAVSSDVPSVGTSSVAETPSSRSALGDHFGPTYFPGKLVIDNLMPSIGTNLVVSNLKREKGMGTSVVLQIANAKAEESLSTKMVPKLAAGAFALRATTKNARFYAHLRLRYKDNHARWSSLCYHNASYRFVQQDHHLINNRWEVLPPRDIAVFNLEDLEGHGEKQFQVCGRWSETDYDLWFNGQHLVGGEIQDEHLFGGLAGPLEFAIRAIENGEANLTFEELWVWDQSSVPIAKSFSDKLPMRKNVQTIR